jgi:hypothetical protein
MIRKVSCGRAGSSATRGRAGRDPGYFRAGSTGPAGGWRMAAEVTEMYFLIRKLVRMFKQRKLQKQQQSQPPE